MKESQFFFDLLAETGKVFQESPIRDYQKEHKKNWNYAVCETPIQIGRGLIFGLNWGGDDKNTQTQYPVAEKERNWNFMNNSIRYFKEYLNIIDIGEVNYSNLCFFRSPKVKFLTQKDWELSLPLFRKYVEYINPSWTVLLGKKGVSILNDFGHLTSLVRIEARVGKKSFVVLLVVLHL